MHGTISVNANRGEDLAVTVQNKTSVTFRFIESMYRSPKNYPLLNDRRVRRPIDPSGNNSQRVPSLFINVWHSLVSAVLSLKVLVVIESSSPLVSCKSRTAALKHGAQCQLFSLELL